jgi:hypothetical protein
MQTIKYFYLDLIGALYTRNNKHLIISHKCPECSCLRDAFYAALQGKFHIVKLELRTYHHFMLEKGNLPRF